MRTFSNTRTKREIGAASVLAVVASLVLVQWTTVSASSDDVPGPLDDTAVSPAAARTQLDRTGSSSIGNRVWWDADDDGVQDTSEPGLGGVEVTVTDLGLDGALGGDDDQPHFVTTDVNGEYVIEGLPSGSYRVTADASGLAPGFVPTYDLDGGVISPDAVWTGVLVEGTPRRDIDFGYDGSGSVGDTVWFDQDADGVQDEGEPGLDDVSVTVSWLGADGAVGGADDRSFVTTTDVDGRYVVDHLPGGTVTVAVAADSLPAGFTTQTGDPDAALDGAGTVVLSAGGSNVAQDFGYTGTASIGDTVWFDRDGDGVRDSNDEGLAGATVSLVWNGPDGVAGGRDDATFERTTNASGRYLFDNLPAGSYSVGVEGLPPDYVNTFDADLDLDAHVSVELLGAQHLLTTDFGYSGATAVGDRVWWDIDADGVQDPGEPGLGGVEITVTSAGPDGLPGTADDIVFVRSTDRDGRYSVSNTPQGDYTVAVTGGVPSGMTVTFDEDGAAASSDQSALVTLGAAAHNTADFGFAGSGSIGDLLYLDLDGNGMFGNGDRGLPGVGVALHWAGPDGAFETPDDITSTTVTDASGSYAFRGLPAGEFRVSVDLAGLPAGLVSTTHPGAGDPDLSVPDPGGDIGQVHLVPGGIDMTQDLGYRGTGSVGDLLWLDLDGDGAFSNGEPGLAMVDISVIWAGVDARFGTADDVVSTDVTDRSGRYLAEDLPAGAYRIAVDATDLAAGVGPTTDPDGGADNGSSLTLAAGVDRLEQDFGYRGDASVGGRVWIDVDADGVQDANEPGYGGLPMKVLVAGRDQSFGSADDTSIQTITSATGTFEVTGLPEGEVRVSYAHSALSVGYAPGSDADGAGPTSTRSSLTTGESATGVDFGVRGTASLGDVVWNDVDGDGVHDEDERGVAGVTVEAVWVGSLGRVTLRSVTGADGSWSFTALPPGSYTVSTVAAAASPGMAPATRQGVSSMVPAGGSASARLPQVASASIGDLIWLDADLDGVRDSTEQGIAGVTVRLLDERGSMVTTTDTDEAGRYLFAGLSPENYRLVVDLRTVPDGHRQSGDPDGVLDANTLVTARAGDARMGEDFSFGPSPLLPILQARPWRNLALGLSMIVGPGLPLVATRRRRPTAAGRVHGHVG